MKKNIRSKILITLGMGAILSPNLYATNNNALSLLTDTLKIETAQPDTLPIDISILFADLKYKNGKLKICEFGGQTAGIADTSVMVNGIEEILATPYWSLFWHYLKKLNLPLWYVGEQHPDIITELKEVGGRSFATFKRFSKFINRKQKKQKTNPPEKQLKKIKSHEGILVVRKPIGAKRRKLLKKHPNIIIVNHNTRRFTVKKHAYKLFESHEELKDYMPLFKAYPKTYSSTLATQIINEIQADFYIIKPINALQSRGVIMTTKQNLDEYLQLILRDTNTISPYADKSLSYWLTDTNDTFFVEAYAPSKIIKVGSKWYDPTMRMVFFLSHEQDTITINVVAGYWKIPIKSLTHTGTLTEKHITKPFSGHFFTGIAIDPQDMHNVKSLLKEMLPAIYLRMLGA